MRIPTALIALAACLLVLALPAAALANGSDDRIVGDCQHSATGALSGSYTKAQLNHALHNLPGDVLEYTGCYDAIREALLASAGGDPSGGGTGPNGTRGTGGGAGGGTDGGIGGSGSAAVGGATPNVPPPPGADRPVSVAGTTVAPGALPRIGSDSHRLPTALLVLLLVLGVAVLATPALTIGRRVVAARRP
jgi:hypothetical protein